MRKNKVKQFKFPDQLLEQINENTFGGFLLFALNEQQIPEVFASFDNPGNSLLTQAYVSNWIKSVEETHRLMTVQQMINGSSKK